jgi:hypothetical protein
MIVSELPPEVASTDEAFTRALTPKSFAGFEFEPYSLARQLYAIEICGEDAGWQTSVIVHMWICTQSEDQVYAARKNRKQALKDAMAWAEKCGIRRTNSKQMDELIKVFNETMLEISESTQLMPSDDNGNEPKNDGRQLG